MCEKAMRDDPRTLLFVPDWFVGRGSIDVWYDENYDDDGDHWDDEIIEWYEGYKKCKAQKAKIKEELLPIPWHSSRWWDWCM